MKCGVNVVFVLCLFCTGDGSKAVPALEQLGQFSLSAQESPGGPEPMTPAEYIFFWCMTGVSYICVNAGADASNNPREPMPPGQTTVDFQTLMICLGHLIAFPYGIFVVLGWTEFKNQLLEAKVCRGIGRKSDCHSSAGTLPVTEIQFYYAVNGFFLWFLNFSWNTALFGLGSVLAGLASGAVLPSIALTQWLSGSSSYVYLEYISFALCAFGAVLPTGSELVMGVEVSAPDLFSGVLGVFGAICMFCAIPIITSKYVAISGGVHSIVFLAGCGVWDTVISLAICGLQDWRGVTDMRLILSKFSSKWDGGFVAASAAIFLSDFLLMYPSNELTIRVGAAVADLTKMTAKQVWYPIWAYLNPEKIKLVQPVAISIVLTGGYLNYMAQGSKNTTSTNM